jgi:hypothetical protein
LLTVAFDACFVDVDYLSLLNLLTDLLVLAATDARSALGRVPRGRAREFKLIELLDSVSDLSIRESMIR